MTETPLAKLLSEKGLTQQQVADAVGTSRQAVQRWSAGSPPSLANLKKLANYLGVSVSALVSEDKAAELTMARVTDVSAPPAEYAQRVPVFDVYAACGNRDIEAGAQSDQDVVVGFIDFAKAFLQRLAGVTSLGHLKVVNTRGDSMEPTILQKSFVLVDSNQTRLTADGIYCLRVHGQIFLKRIQRDLDGSILLLSDNPRYQPRQVSRTDLENAEIIGRIIFCFNGCSL